MSECVRIFKVGDEHGVKYDSCKEASVATGIPSNTIYHWMRNFPGKVYKTYDGTQYRIRPCRNRKEVATFEKRIPQTPQRIDTKRMYMQYFA